MKFFGLLFALIFYFLILPFSALAQEGSKFQAATTALIVPPPVAPPAFNPCESGQCDYGKKHRKTRDSFGSKRNKSLSSFGKRGGRRAKEINGGVKTNKSRSARRYKHH